MTTVQTASSGIVFDAEFAEYQRAFRKNMRMRDELFYTSVLFPGTAMGIRAELLLRVPHLVEVTVATTAPGQADVHLELPAWAWLTLGILHLVTWRRARQWLRRCAPAKAVIRVRMGARRNARPVALAPTIVRSVAAAP